MDWRSWHRKGNALLAAEAGRFHADRVRDVLGRNIGFKTGIFPGLNPRSSQAPRVGAWMLRCAGYEGAHSGSPLRQAARGRTLFIARAAHLAGPVPGGGWAPNFIGSPARTPPGTGPHPRVRPCCACGDASCSAPTRPRPTPPDAGASGSAEPLAGLGLTVTVLWRGPDPEGSGIRTPRLAGAAALLSASRGRGSGRRSRLGPPRTAATLRWRSGCSTSFRPPPIARAARWDPERCGGPLLRAFLVARCRPPPRPGEAHGFEKGWFGRVWRIAMRQNSRVSARRNASKGAPCGCFRRR